MATTTFDTLRAEIDADPERRARVDAEKPEVLREQLFMRLAQQERGDLASE